MDRGEASPHWNATVLAGPTGARVREGADEA